MQTVLEEDAAVHALPPLSGEDRQRVQGSSLSEVREWALSKAALSPSDLYAYRLRTLYNSTLPVSRLPPETLFRIFDFFRQDCVSSMWVTKLTGICRYWRDILVSSPLAWSSIDLEHSVPFIELCLSRSADADLDVVLNETNTDPFASNAPSVKNELAPHFHRIARLELWSYSLERLQEAQLLSMLEGPMPRLTELSIWCMVPTSLQIRLNDAHFPRLQKLSLDHPSVHLYGLMLPRLTMLSLSDVARDGQPNLNTIIHLLKAAPAMRVLILRNSGPILPLSAPSPPKRPVVLNSMRVLTFHGRSTQCRALLSRLSLPRGVHIWLSVIAQPVTPSIPTDSEEYKSILDDIKLVGSLSDMRFASLQVKQRYFALRADPNRLGYRSKDPLLRIEFRNTYFITKVQSDNFFQTLLSELPLLFPQSLTSLSLDGDSMSVVDVKRWGQTFVSFPHLLKLHLVTGSVLCTLRNLVEALRPADGLILCPELRCLIVDSARLAKVDEEVDQLLDLLASCLERRSQAGARLKELQLCFRRLDELALTQAEDYTRRFQGMVDVFKCDDTASWRGD